MCLISAMQNHIKTEMQTFKKKQKNNCNSTYEVDIM